MTVINPLRRYIRGGRLPHFFCPGCGCGQVLNTFLRAVEKTGFDLQRSVCIGGVGCTARIPVYLDCDVLHGVHGRTFAWATGIKLHRPEVPVVIFAGDGDAASIGGNHLIHAARRNLDVTVFVVNNFNFAMTGGQVAPMTPEGSVTMTTPYGSAEPEFDLCRLVAAAGGSYVARGSTTDLAGLGGLMVRAMRHRGFSLVEILSQCPTHYGRYALGSGDPMKTLEWMASRQISAAKAAGAGAEKLKGKYVLGEFANEERPVFRGSSPYGTGGERHGS